MYFQPPLPETTEPNPFATLIDSTRRFPNGPDRPRDRGQLFPRPPVSALVCLANWSKKALMILISGTPLSERLSKAGFLGPS